MVQKRLVLVIEGDKAMLESSPASVQITAIAAAVMNLAELRGVKTNWLDLPGEVILQGGILSGMRQKLLAGSAAPQEEDGDSSPRGDLLVEA